jgi:tripartite-type tricarboxylate transporter receptor subunit TctC
MPEIPTLSDAGFAEFDSTRWLGLLAPRGTSPEVVQRLYIETAKALALPAVKDQFTKAALQPVGSTPEAFSAVIRKEVDYWGKAAQELGIEPQ